MNNKIFNKDEKIKELSEFILNRDIKEFRIKINARKYIVLKIKLTDNIDQIFCCYFYQTQEQTIEQYDKFEHSGYIKNGILYDRSYSFSSILNALEVSHWNNSFDTLMLKKRIEKYMNEIIIKRWEYFKGQKSSNSEIYKTINAEQMVNDWIIKEKLEEVPNYEYNTSVEFTKEEYVQYLDEGENFIYTKGNELIDQYKYSIHNTIVRYEAAVKMFNEKKNNPDLIHVRDMNQALVNSKAKTVKIRIVKDNQQPIQVTIPIRAIENCSPKSFISLYVNLSKYDRDLFESVYGNGAALYPEDIDEIIYRNKTIYKRGE